MVGVTLAPFGSSLAPGVVLLFIVAQSLKQTFPTSLQMDVSSFIL